MIGLSHRIKQRVMKFNTPKFLVKILLTFFITQTLSVTAEESDSPVVETSDWQLRFGVDSKPFVDSNKDDLDIAKTSIEAELKKIFDPTASVRSIFGISVKVAGSPFILKDSTGKKLMNKANEKIDLAEAAAQKQREAAIDEAMNTLNKAIKEARAKAYSELNQKVLDAINANPYYSSIYNNPNVPQSIKNKIFETGKHKGIQTIENAVAQGRADGLAQIDEANKDAKAEIKQKIAKARLEAEKLINDRLDYLQTETALQEVAIIYSRENGEGMITFKVGKFEVKGSDESFSDMRPVNDISEALASTMGTGALQVGVAKVFDYNRGDKQGTASVTLAVFHDRGPVISGSELIGDIVTMSEEDFAVHKRFWQLNTAMLTLMVKTQKASFYISGAAGEYHQWISTGASIELLKNLEFGVRTYFGNREQADSSVSSYLAYKAGRARLYVGVSAVCGRSSVVENSSALGDYLEAFAGCSYEVGNVKVPFTMNMLTFKGTRISVEGYTQKNSHSDECISGCRAGVGFHVGN